LAVHRPVDVFHYHLITSRVREVEARYVGKLGFALVARYGSLGDDLATFGAGVGWSDLDERGFRLRLSELELGAVNVVVQPGRWDVPRVDHVGLALTDDEFDEAIEVARGRGLTVQEHGGRRTFVSTGAGFRLELHPPREWLEELLDGRERLYLGELRLKADDPEAKAGAFGELLGLTARDAAVSVNGTIVRFVEGGPQGRPELHAELFL
jgi:hypothetical protein